MESLFVLWRATRDTRYRDWGWQMLRAWERFCRVGTGGYASLNSVLLARAGRVLGLLLCVMGPCRSACAVTFLSVHRACSILQSSL